MQYNESIHQYEIRLGTLCSIIICKIDEQTIYREYDSHSVPHISGFMSQLS